jgi:hypothetical protein
MSLFNTRINLNFYEYIFNDNYDNIIPRHNITLEHEITYNSADELNDIIINNINGDHFSGNNVSTD